jgi:hypothetical protein
MDIRKLLKGLTEKVVERVENREPENPQDKAIEDLEARTMKFEKRELDNTLYSAGGGYFEKVNGEDVRNARALFGFVKGRDSIMVVGYLHPTPNGEVLIKVNDLTVDRLTKTAAKKVHPKLSEPVPVKISVSIIPSKDPVFDRPHLVLAYDNKPPLN